MRVLTLMLTVYESVKPLNRPDKPSNRINDKMHQMFEKVREFNSYLNQLIILIIQNF
jgi:hypothetical protein